MRLSILNAGYPSTNVWVLSHGRTRLLVDLGWPRRLGALLAALRRLDVPVAEIGHGFATHYHIDHAGCAEELKARGIHRRPHAAVDGARGRCPDRAGELGRAAARGATMAYGGHGAPTPLAHLLGMRTHG